MNDVEEVARLYREVILANARRPVGFGRAIGTTHRAARDNPLCGDDIEIRLRIRGDTIQDAAFDGEACAICMASASLLCQHLPGLAVPEIGATLAAFRNSLASVDAGDCPGFLRPMLGVRDYPARIDCATLPWLAAEEASA